MFFFNYFNILLDFYKKMFYIVIRKGVIDLNKEKEKTTNVAISESLHRQLKKHCANTGQKLRFVVEKSVFDEMMKGRKKP